MLKFNVANFHMPNAQMERENRICCMHAKKYMAQYINNNNNCGGGGGNGVVVVVVVVTVAVEVAAAVMILMMMINKYNIAYH